MKGRGKRVQKRKGRFVKYSALTLLFACLFVAGYNMISTGTIFGKFTFHDPYIESAYANDPSKAETISQAELTVTPKNSYTKILNPDPDSGLPQVPETNGSIVKGTKENPLLILEIVPEMSQQSLSYLVQTKEEGAPFESAMDLGREISTKKNSPFVTKGQDVFYGNNEQFHVPKDTYFTKIVNTCLNSVGAWFNNNNENGGFYIYNPNGTVYGAERKTYGEEDRTQAPWAYMGVHYTIEKVYDKTDIENATNYAKNMYRRPEDGGKSIADIYVEDETFRDVNGETISQETLDDEKNWARTFISDTKYIETNSKTMSQVDFESDFDKLKDNTLSLADFATNYPALFTKYTSINYTAEEDEYLVKDEDLEQRNKWQFEKKIDFVHGYFLYVGEGNGDYTIKNSDNAPTYDAGKGNYIYVAKLPEQISEIQGGYFVYRGEGKGDYNITGEDSITYKKGKGSYTFEFTMPQIEEVSDGYLIYKGAGKGTFDINLYTGPYYSENGSYDFVPEVPEDAVNRWQDEMQAWQVDQQDGTYETEAYIDKAYFSIEKFASMNKDWMKKIKLIDLWKEGVDASDVFDSEKNSMYNNPNWANLAYFSIDRFTSKDWMSNVKPIERLVVDNVNYSNVAYVQANNMKSGDWMNHANPQKDISYKFIYNVSEKHIFRYEYIGMKTNDILKRMLFHFEDEKDSSGKVTKTADEQYEDTYIKVISLTPAMINEMDAEDTESTLDVVERADVFFFGSYYYGHNGSTKPDGIDDLLRLYYDYLDPERNSEGKKEYDYQKDSMASFYENDLEWIDCMKIVKRLSGDSSLPMTFSKQVSEMLDEGAKRDGSNTSCYYVNDVFQHAETAGSLNNIAKLYLITSQFDLSARKEKKGNKIEYVQTFMEDVYDNIKKVPVAENENSVKNSAKYTGFYERHVANPAVDGCSHDIKYRQNCYYLWSVYTFMPTVALSADNSPYAGDNGKSLIEANLLKYGFLQSSIANYSLLFANGGGDYDKIVGTIDPHKDNQNVLIAGDHSYHEKKDNVSVNTANPNFVVYEGGTMGAIGKIWFDIMNNGGQLTPVMKFSVLNTKQSRKYYTKISDSSVLLDYAQGAEYKSGKKVYIYCHLDNQDNEETSIITSVKLLNTKDDSQAPITLYPETLDGDLIDRENVSFDEEQEFFEDINGYPVSENDSLDFRVAFELDDWLNKKKADGSVLEGYTMLRVEWVARTSKGTNTSYKVFQNPESPDEADAYENSGQYAEVDIGERGLFGLE